MSGAVGRPTMQATRGELSLFTITWGEGASIAQAISTQNGTLAPVALYVPAWPSPTPLVRLLGQGAAGALYPFLVDGAEVDLTVAAGSIVPVPAIVAGLTRAVAFRLVDAEGDAETFGADVSITVAMAGVR